MENKDDEAWQDAVEADIADPARITTHERCLELVALIDGDIAEIETKLQQHDIRYSVDEPPAYSLDWKFRAMYAANRMRGDRRRLVERDRELRGIKEFNERTARVEAKAMARVKAMEAQQAVVADSKARKAARKAAKQANHAIQMASAREHSLDAMFRKVAFNRLSQAQYSEWVTEAKALRQEALTPPVASSQVADLSA